MIKIGGIDHQNLYYNVYQSEDGHYQRETVRPYYRASKHHIFIDPVYVNTPHVPELLDKIAKKGNQHVHIFISEWYKEANLRVIEFIGFLNRDPASGLKIYIHVPKMDPQIGNIMDAAINGIRSKVRVIREGRGVSYFASEDILKGRFYQLTLSYELDGLKVGISTGSYTARSLGGIMGNPNPMNSNGPLADEDILNNMDVFKDKIINGFKAACPPGILKGFKDDEDIWTFINGCEMKVKVEGEDDNETTGNDH